MLFAEARYAVTNDPEQALGRHWLMLKDQASCRTVSENAAIFIRQLSFGGTDPAPTIDDAAFSLHEAGLRRDGSNKRNLELEGCLRNSSVEHGQHGETHAAVEQRGRKASVHSAERVAVPRIGFCSRNDTALGNLDNIVAERFRHRVQRQRAIDEPLNKFETAHFLSLLVVYDAKTFPNRA
jgi:hypothetical protein